MPDLADFILVLKDFMAPEVCDEIIKDCSPKAKRALVEGNIEHPSRTCSQIVLRFQETFVPHGVQAMRTYCSKHTNCRLSDQANWLYVRYDEGQFYKQHVDEFPGKPRLVTISVALNADYDGGEWCWFDRQIQAKLKKGDAVMFPSNWMYPHEIAQVTNGTRHALINWFS